MKLHDSERVASRTVAPICGFMLCLAGAVAVGAESTPYSSTALNGNLQNQCQNFAAALVQNTSLTVSAECNKQGSNADTVVTGHSTSFDLSGDVQWDTNSHTISWDSAVTATNLDIAAKCELDGDSPFTVTASDVTLALRCSQQVTDGTPATSSVSLPLNGKLQAGTDGELSRR